MSPCKLFNNSATADIIKRGSFFSVDSPPSHDPAISFFSVWPMSALHVLGGALGCGLAQQCCYRRFASIIAKWPYPFQTLALPLPGRAVLMTETAAAVDAPGNLVRQRHHSWP
jgi:hypothetical protein